jgi:hypothetical protein
VDEVGFFGAGDAGVGVDAFAGFAVDGGLEVGDEPFDVEAGAPMERTEVSLMGQNVMRRTGGTSRREGEAGRAKGAGETSGFLLDWDGAKTKPRHFRAGARRPIPRGHESRSGRPQRAIIGKSTGFSREIPPKSERNPLPATSCGRRANGSRMRKLAARDFSTEWKKFRRFFHGGGVKHQVRWSSSCKASAGVR